METLEEKRIGKYLIKILPDNNPMEPENDEEFGFIVYDHRQFYVEKKGFEPREIFEHLQSGRKTYNGYWVFVLYAYIHSGVALSVGGHDFPDARWDVSTTGFVMVKREKGTYREKDAMKRAKLVVKVWNEYLGGCACGYEIDEIDGGEEDFVDSCWGWYDTDECMKEAEGVVNYMIEKDEKKEKENQKLKSEMVWEHGLWGKNNIV